MAARELCDLIKSSGRTSASTLLVGLTDSDFTGVNTKSCSVNDFLSNTVEHDVVIVNDILSNNNNDSHVFAALIRSVNDNGVVFVRQNMQVGSVPVALSGNGNTKITGDTSTLTMASLTHCFEVFKTSTNKGARSLRMKYVKQMECSIRDHANYLDFCWCLERAPVSASEGGVYSDEHASFRDFLDQTQYKDSGVLAYEWIFGYGFISPGGAKQNLEFLKQLNLKSTDFMLDVGCGIGGSLHQAVERYGCRVLGVDLSSNMLNVALERLQEKPDDRIRYMLADVMTHDYGENEFDVIYSRDCIQHIGDKQTLYARFYKWLKPGGTLLTTGYTAGTGEFSEKFKAYLKQRHYGLKHITEYEKACKSAGFSKVSCTDMTQKFREILLAEINHANTNKSAFLEKFSAKEFDGLLEGWQNKIGYIDAQNHCWTQVLCTK